MRLGFGDRDHSANASGRDRAPCGPARRGPHEHAHLGPLIYALAVLRDPGSPAVGLRAGLGLLLDILPRLVAALVITGMLQVLISPEWIQRWLGRSAGSRGIFIGFVAGILTPGGPMVSFPMVAVFYQSGASLAALVTYVTSWSLFGFQILAWERRFVLARVVLPTLVLPIVAGYLVRLFYRD